MNTRSNTAKFTTHRFMSRQNDTSSQEDSSGALVDLLDGTSLILQQQQCADM
jgi:hypothetical protein